MQIHNHLLKEEVRSPLMSYYKGSLPGLAMLAVMAVMVGDYYLISLQVLGCLKQWTFVTIL